MSLLEDIFLQDEADEAQELERVIEGDEFDERPRSRSRSPDNSDDNTPKDDEAEEDKRRVDPSSTKTKRVTKNPRFILNPARLTGPRGIQILPDHFKDFKFKGKGHEKEDLDMVLKKLEHWAYRLYPKFQFEDCLKKIESLGKKRPVMVHLQKIRTDQFISGETVVQKDSSDEETQPPQEEDEFDKLLQQQIDLARATPAPGSVKKVMHTPVKDRSPFTMPKATSSPSISDDQKERMIRNRKLAEERRLARLKQNSMESTGKPDNVIIEVDEEVETNVSAKKQNRSHVISSDDECDVSSVNQSVSVDVHNGTKDREKNNDKSEDVVENRENLDDDIEMADKNNAIEDVEEIIDDADKDIGRNVRVIEPTDKHVEIIEINDPNDRIIERNRQTKVVDVVIVIDAEINNIVGGTIEIEDESNQGTTEVIDINGPEDKRVDDVVVMDDVVEIMEDVTHKDGRISNDTEVLKEIDDTTTVDGNISNKAPEEEINRIVNDNSTENQSKASENDNAIQKDVMEEIQDGEKDSNSSNSTKEVTVDKDATIAEVVIEDIMDVDFSDDF